MTSTNYPRNTPTQGPGETQHNVRDAALKGATSAFTKPPVKPKPQVNTYTGGDDGALRAASKGWTGSLSPQQASLSPMQRNWTGGSQRPTPSPRRVLSKSSSSSTLDIPIDELDRIPSPSNIAAKLAAARHTPMKPKPEARTGAAQIARESDIADILPPPGSVGNARALFDTSDKQPSPNLKRSPNRSPGTNAKHNKAQSDNKPTDGASIALTSSLVKMFEQSRPTTAQIPRDDSVIVAQGPPPPVKSPKPQRSFRLPPEPEQSPEPRVIKEESTKPPAPKKKPDLPIPQQKLAELATVKTSIARSKPPPPRRGSRPKSQDSSVSALGFRRLSGSLDGGELPSSPSSAYASAPETQPKVDTKAKPELPPPRRSAKTIIELQTRPENNAQSKPDLPPPRRTATSKTDGRSVLLEEVQPKGNLKLSPKKAGSPGRASASTVPPERYLSPTQSDSAPSTYHSPYQRDSVRQITKHMTGESLANAMLGAALASSRNPSPAPPSRSPQPPALPSRQQAQKHHHLPFHSRTPSPPKSKPAPGKMRTTLRKEASSSDSEDESERYKRKGTRVLGMGRKHPNKHHEGTRKRWRDKITERERKRYEGVWAANKGLYIATGPQDEDPNCSTDVQNLIAKDIWNRSRLPTHELEEIWDVVDSRCNGRLRREEFVVGMWLIDQRLKGRKIPIKVSESVWGSVRGVGVKVRVKH